MRLVRPALLLAVAALLTPVTAGAEDVSGSTFRQLAARAADDPAARERLLRVDSVDGVPVDLERALAGAQGAELTKRLDVLAGGEGPPSADDPDAARREAREILAERRFRGTELPRPLAGVLSWIGERLSPFADAIDRIASWLPGGERTLWGALAAVVLAVAVIASLTLARRRSGRAFGPTRVSRGVRFDPDQLEREADAAERRGELERALRLRFRAGLLRLDRLEAIEYRDSLTSSDVARRIHSPAFDRVAGTFDQVVYGRRPARRDDVEGSRAGWPQVLIEAGSPKQ